MTAYKDLATFDDRWTLRYVRVFRAPIQRVSRAVTTSEELNIWLYPVSRVEPKLGGRVTFTWGLHDRTSAGRSRALGPSNRPPNAASRNFVHNLELA